MSDFYGALESTCFRVRDRAAFLADPAIVYLQQYVAHPAQNGFFQEDEKALGYFAFGFEGQYPDPTISRPATEADPPEARNDRDEIEYNLLEAIQRHILPGDVCRMQVSGQEKLIYVGGVILWVTSKGFVEFNGTTEWEHKLTEADLLKEAADLHSDVAQLLALPPGGDR